jgi:hypothetical protein
MCDQIFGSLITVHFSHEFFCVNDGRFVDLVNVQFMHYMICYNEQANLVIIV